MKKFITFTLVLMMTFGVLMGIVYAKDDDTIVILYENDVHCAIEGYSKLAAMKKELLETYSNVGVVSSGDFVQGGTMGAVSKGEYIVNLMNKVGYDAITLGNHEFDYKLSRLAELINPSDVLLSVMSQYTPEFALDSKYSELHRRITSFEYTTVCDKASELGFNGFTQAKESASARYTPDFAKNNNDI